jgi:hypothetical protein
VHNCFTTGSVGCTDPDCCEAVCAIDPFCCDVFWDSICVGEAVDLCDGCGDPDAGNCFVSHSSTFCNDRDCCEAVCAVDPFCCNVSWDGICANEAKQMCCPADLNDDGFVNTLDLLDLIESWGACLGCQADLSGDGTVNTLDLLDLIEQWGPCPPK